MEQVTIYTHGAAVSEPGAAAIAVQAVNEAGDVLVESVASIGNATELFAAFGAVVFGLEAVREKLTTAEAAFELVLGNESVVEYLTNKLPVTNPSIVAHFIEIHNVRVEHFPQLTVRKGTKKEMQAVQRLVTKELDAPQ